MRIYIPESDLEIAYMLGVATSNEVACFSGRISEKEMRNWILAVAKKIKSRRFYRTSKGVGVEGGTILITVDHDDDDGISVEPQ